MTFIAHINQYKQQTCKDHCRHTAEYAATSLADIGMSNSAYLAGLLHDCGKFTSEFDEYINKASAGEYVRKGSVIHSFAGVYYLLKNFHSASIPGFQELTSELLSYAIGSHHGLFDCYDEDSKNGYIHRLIKQPEYEEQAIENFHKECAGIEEINQLFAASVEEVTW